MAPRADAAQLLLDADDRLAHGMPHPQCELDHQSPWQLLVATILSAQAKDSVINEITPALFERWPTPADLAEASQEEVEIAVKRSGHFRNKAKAIRECARALVERHGGEVPRTHEELVALPGASHKTANLVLGVAFGIASGIVVDTHVARVTERLGVSKASTPEAVEKLLCGLVPRERWIDFSHRFILHGRHLCTAAKPACPECPLFELCPSTTGQAIGDWRERSRREGELAAHRGDRAAAGLAPASSGESSLRPTEASSSSSSGKSSKKSSKKSSEKRRAGPPKEDDF